MKNAFLKYIIWLAFVWLQVMSGFELRAQSHYSYLYIEGDKETPFYVKMEGKMVPRLSQNYCILSNLDAGVTNIEILFQQNKYAPVKFAVKIPKGASRGLMLRKVDDNFALYDLQTGHYIFAGNKASEDDISGLEKLIARQYQQQHNPAPAVESKQPEAVAANTKTAATPAKKDDPLPAFNPGGDKPADTPRQPKPDKKAETVKTVKPVKDSKEKKVPATAKERAKEPEAPAPRGEQKSKYLSNVVINGEEGTAPAEDDVWPSDLPPNTDCSGAMSDTEFDAFMKKLKSKEDESRIKFVQKNKKLCFTTEQVSYIGRSIGSTSGKLQVLKQLYAQTTDQQNYHMLEHLFKTDYLKQKFRETINAPK